MKKGPTTKHFDAWGNPILGLLEMREYYKGRPQSMSILEKNLPHRYVVIPDTTVRMHTSNTTEVIVTLHYPCGDREIVRFLNQRSLNALRNTFRGRKGWSKEITNGNWVIFRHKGCVLLEPSGKFFSRKLSVSEAS